MEKIKIIIRSFIPQKTVDSPSPGVVNQTNLLMGKGRTFEGDNRNAGEHPDRYRTQQTITIETDPLKSGGKPLLSNDGIAGLTREILPNGSIAEARANGDTLKANASYMNLPLAHILGINVVSITATGNENNPLVKMSPGISYNLNITVASGADGALGVQVNGDHDGFPAYEVLIVRPDTGDNSEHLITDYNPNDHNKGPWSLFPPMDEHMEGGKGFAPR